MAHLAAERKLSVFANRQFSGQSTFGKKKLFFLEKRFRRQNQTLFFLNFFRKNPIFFLPKNTKKVEKKILILAAEKFFFQFRKKI